ncbi:MAG: M15 family metallopeptidase [Candidatus Sericytochromatia bacterium]|nr:M15 family metallopeptidase [Candidatus Sericytochromatia bacterium]
MRLKSWGVRPRQEAWAVAIGGAAGPPTALRLELVAIRAELQRLQAELGSLTASSGLPAPAAPAAPGPPPPVAPAPPPPPPPPPAAPRLPRDQRVEARPAPSAGQGPLVREGLRGEPVRALQARLRALGFDAGPRDGLFGPRTQAAVRAFQRARGLEVDGVVGPRTWAALGIEVTGQVRAWGSRAPAGPGRRVDPGAPVPLVSRQGHQMHAALARDWDRMVEAAARDGVRLTITSGYRSVAHQRRLWDEALRKYGSASAARRWVAPPGRSNHQQGKALDIANSGGAHAWLRRNGAQFGFYQPMSWEPWHWEHDL